MMLQGMLAFVSVVALVTLIQGGTVNAILLPNVHPQTFSKDEVVPIQVNVLTSVRTHLPYDYYSALPTCLPKVSIGGKVGNIGGVLMGDRIKSSPYENTRLLRNITCATICEKKVEDEKQRNFLIKAIKANYRINLLLDGLPLAEVNRKKEYVIGVPLGYMDHGIKYVNNHIHFTIKYTSEEVKGADGDVETKYRILSFVGQPYSLEHRPEHACESLMTGKALASIHPLPATSDRITWSYGVSWVRGDDKWSSRWDVYLNVHRHNIHWYSIINSTFFVAFLTVLIAASMFRVVRRDLRKISGIDLDNDDAPEDSGWKLLNRDVFRPPPNGWLLACFTGTGVQLIGMACTVLIFASLGFFSPQSRGSLFTAVLVCFAFLGLYAGYTSARLLKLWNATKWKYVFATGTVVPAMAFGTFFVMNFLVWSQSSSAAVPFFSLTVVMGIWIFINVPLVFLGAILGFKRGTISVPSPYNQIPRHVPLQPWYTSKAVVLLSGFPPFAAVFIEVYFILGALWLNRYYYVFGFLLLVGFIMLLTSSEIAIVMVYLSLCAEDYRWWWRAFFIGASSGVFLFLYSVFYVVVGNLHIEGLVPMMLYLSYMALLSFLFAVTTGAVGFLACFWFVRYIYRYIKVD
ncbi:putative endosomal integral membrane protein [Trypanosoma grayi]|uniref:putative endosomal integral membrane protein n=1 Tax=Trypanosoma grayi TaxID=71804 RepID=UPI0004F4AFEC|nr:putative endosomal integral membrane protein [Trypanosoma grayi]KEG07737.1 putative endosomal integral membrane protein [Trypanosoma grayi]